MTAFFALGLGIWALLWVLLVLLPGLRDQERRIKALEDYYVTKRENRL